MKTQFWRKVTFSEEKSERAQTKTFLDPNVSQLFVENSIPFAQQEGVQLYTRKTG